MLDACRVTVAPCACPSVFNRVSATGGSSPAYTARDKKENDHACTHYDANQRKPVNGEPDADAKRRPPRALLAPHAAEAAPRAHARRPQRTALERRATHRVRGMHPHLPATCGERAEGAEHAGQPERGETDGVLYGVGQGGARVRERARAREEGLEVGGRAHHRSAREHGLLGRRSCPGERPALGRQPSSLVASETVICGGKGMANTG